MASRCARSGRARGAAELGGGGARSRDESPASGCGGALPGTAEGIPVADDSFSAVFCGESFHWFDWGLAIPEIARVLVPGGGLVVMWNRPSGGLSSAEGPP